MYEDVDDEDEDLSRDLPHDPQLEREEELWEHLERYLRHRLGGGDSDRDRDREDEDEDEDEDSLAPSELELKERLARLRPALQLSVEGLGESWGLR